MQRSLGRCQGIVQRLSSCIDYLDGVRDRHYRPITSTTTDVSTALIRRRDYHCRLRLNIRGTRRGSSGTSDRQHLSPLSTCSRLSVDDQLLALLLILGILLVQLSQGLLLDELVLHRLLLLLLGLDQTRVCTTLELELLLELWPETCCSKLLSLGLLRLLLNLDLLELQLLQVLWLILARRLV